MVEAVKKLLLPDDPIPLLKREVELPGEAAELFPSLAPIPARVGSPVELAAVSG